MKVKIELIERPTPDKSLMLRLPDGDEVFATDSAYSLIFRLETIGMSLDNGFTIDDGRPE